MKSEEVLNLPIIIGIGSPPFQVKVTTLRTENTLLYLILNQQAMRVGRCILGLNSVTFKSTFEFNDVAQIRPAQLKVKINVIQFTSTRN